MFRAQGTLPPGIARKHRRRTADYLKGSYDLLRSRMITREDHFMKQHLLQSQFETLEQPVKALVVDVSPSIDEIVRMILHRLE